ncbi:MAG: hypothetical protein E7E47_15760 [Clostridium perfringens]|nr:hypothetical protein [Clostridium perfringens]
MDKRRGSKSKAKNSSISRRKNNLKKSIKRLDIIPMWVYDKDVVRK